MVDQTLSTQRLYPPYCGAILIAHIRISRSKNPLSSLLYPLPLGFRSYSTSRPSLTVLIVYIVLVAIILNDQTHILSVHQVVQNVSPSGRAVWGDSSTFGQRARYSGSLSLDGLGYSRTRPFGLGGVSNRRYRSGSNSGSDRPKRKASEARRGETNARRVQQDYNVLVLYKLDNTNHQYRS